MLIEQSGLFITNTLICYCKDMTQKEDVIVIAKSLATMIAAAIIAFAFTYLQNKLSRRRDFGRSSIGELKNMVIELEEVIEKLFHRDSAINPKIVLSALKKVSMKIETLKDCRKKVGVSLDEVDAIRNLYENINKVVTGDSWGQDLSVIVYSSEDIGAVNKGLMQLWQKLDSVMHKL